MELIQIRSESPRDETFYNSAASWILNYGIKEGLIGSGSGVTGGLIGDGYTYSTGFGLNSAASFEYDLGE